MITNSCHSKQSVGDIASFDEISNETETLTPGFVKDMLSLGEVGLVEDNSVLVLVSEPALSVGKLFLSSILITLYSTARTKQSQLIDKQKLSYIMVTIFNCGVALKLADNFGHSCEYRIDAVLRYRRLQLRLNMYTSLY